MTTLTSQKCVPCEGGTQPLSPTEFSVYLPQIVDWEVVENKALKKTFEFKSFRQAMAFVTQVGLLAEKEGHHPDIHLHDYKYVTISTSTHAIGGLSVNDFIIASKINSF